MALPTHICSQFVHPENLYYPLCHDQIHSATGVIDVIAHLFYQAEQRNSGKNVSKSFSDSFSNSMCLDIDDFITESLVVSS